MQRLAWLLMTILFWLSACVSQEESTDGSAFLFKESQARSARLIEGTLEATDSLKLSQYDIFKPMHLAVDGTFLFVSARSQGKVFGINKANRDSFYTIGSGAGEGPGEIRSLTHFTLDDEQMFFRSSRKLLHWTKDGTLILDTPIEVVPYRLVLVDQNSLLAVSPTNASFLFNVLDTQGRFVRGFEKTHLGGELSPLHYEGVIAVDESHLYYAGVSESILKKYTLDGEQVFSVSTIDNHPSEVNYIVFDPGGNRTAMSYAPTALMATSFIEVSGAYLLALPIHDADQSRLSYIDVYSTENGQYIATFDVDPGIRSLAIDKDIIYTLEEGEDDFYVKMYDNFLRNL